MEKLEEQIAHLTRTVEELSDVIARQDTELVLHLAKNTLAKGKPAWKKRAFGCLPHGGLVRGRRDLNPRT